MDNCSVKRCANKAKASIRGKPVCLECFFVFKGDNKLRAKRKLNIPNKLVITSELAEKMEFGQKKIEKYPIEEGGIYGIFQ